MTLTYDDLLAAVTGSGVGIRSRTELEPLGGPGDKVFPPTYGVEDRAETRYAMEKRRVPAAGGGSGTEVVDSVVLDSVASQANRFELALHDAVERGELHLPVTAVDFRPVEELAGLDRLSDLEVPHRIFDAHLRDSFDGDQLFRNGAIGRAITEATSRNAAALYHHSPTTLVFGGWDSTGPKGGRGAKYERAITSEVVALGATRGVKTASRLDPAGIELRAGPLYEAPDGEWTLDKSEAVLEKGKPKFVGAATEESKKQSKEAGRPSQVNHGNVTPSIEIKSGGVTVERIVATTVLSFIQLRRLRFPSDHQGSLLPADGRRAAEDAARAALAALGLAAAALALDEGFDLRSRCVLIPTGPAPFELLSRGGEAQAFTLERNEALALVSEAVDRAADRGLSWRESELLLRPSDRLVALIRRSRDLAEATPEPDEAEV